MAIITNLSLPFDGPVSSAFGRRWLVLPGQLGFWNEHEGCDWARSMGTPVRAAGDGVIYDNVFTSLKGNQLGIQHEGNYRTRYHMLKSKALFSKGQTVKAGQIIGYVGMSGTAATGPHLHFELHYNGKPINPTLTLSYLPGVLAGNSSKPLPNPEPEKTEDKPLMKIKWTVEKKAYVITESGTTYLAPNEFDLIKRVIEHDNDPGNVGDKFNDAEMAIVNSVLQRAAGQVSSSSVADAVWSKSGGKIPSGSDNAKATWDYILDGWNGRQTAGNRVVGIDGKAGTAKVDSSAAIDYAKLGKIVADELAKRLAE